MTKDTAEQQIITGRTCGPTAQQSFHGRVVRESVFRLTLEPASSAADCNGNFISLSPLVQLTSSSLSIRISPHTDQATSFKRPFKNHEAVSPRLVAGFV